MLVKSTKRRKTETKDKRAFNLQIKTVFLYILPKECLEYVLVSRTSSAN